MSTMRVARLVQVNQPLQVGTTEKPTPGPKEVLVKVEACSLVPNSYNIVTGRAGFPLPDLPCIFGLDAAGIIDAVGDHVLNLKVGDRVYIDPFLTCGTCHQCRRGRIDLCYNWCLRAYFALSTGGKKLLARYPIGALSQYMISPDANIAVLPPSISTATASRFGYLGTSFAGLKKAGAGPGKTLLINGVTGTLGYGAVAIGLGLGCTKILGVGRNKQRLAEVESLSPQGRVAVRSSEDESDIIEWIKSQTDGLGPDALYDCLGVGGDVSTTSKLISSIKQGGRAILAAGGADGEIRRSYWQNMMNEVAIIGVIWFNSADLDEMIALIDAGVVDLSFLRNRFFSLNEVNDAFKAAGERPGGAVNIVVRPHD